MSQQCGGCHHLNPDEAKFCLECGTPLARPCPACGRALVPGAKFCMECGTPLEAPPAAPPAAPVSERRTTTVLFGDLVSFTSLAEHRDPEDVRDLLSAYFAVARTIVGRYGGTIEKFIGDAVMAVWGVPTSHEDDAERAVRAGLDLVTEVAALGTEAGAPELAMRVGVVTGSVAVTLGAVGEGMVAGDAVNTAARVQTAADPGTVWVDQETRALTAAAIASTDMGEHSLKGRGPARLFRADTVVAAVGGAQRVDGLEAPMVGRDAELRRVKELFHATEADGRARLALVTGVAGIGKSRLGWEYEKYTDGLDASIAWHRGRCLSYGDGVAYWAFAEMVRSRLGLVDGQPRSEVEERVRTRVAGYAADPDEAAWLTPRVLALLTAGERTAFDRTDLFVAWTTFVDRVGAHAPVVLLVEDVQHAEAAMLDLLEHLLATTRARLFVLALGRPDVLEHRPSLVSARRTTHVALAPLPADVMGTLVDGLVRDLPVRPRAAIVARADGIPLYAVETVRSMIDHDAVVARDGEHVFVDVDHTRVDLDRLAAPTSLQTLIAARLDALSPAERRTVQDASVLGLAFTRDGLTALSDLAPHEVDVAVAGLVRKEVLEQTDDAFAADRGQLRFLQALVREVAHGTLSRRDRRLRHLAAADHLTSLAVADELAGVIAQHLLDALAAGPADDRERTRLQERARRLLERSADAAEALGSPEEALRARATALDLAPDPAERAELLLGLARAARLAGRAVEAETHVQAAVAAAHRLGGGRPWIAAQHEHARQLVLSSRLREAAEIADTALAAASTTGADPAILCDLHSAAGAAARGLGDLEAARHHSVQAAALAETLDDPVRLIDALNYVGSQASSDGLPTVTLAVTRTALELARSTGQIRTQAQSLNNLASATYPADLPGAGEQAVEAARLALSTGDAYLSEVALMNAGFTQSLSGAWDELEHSLGTWLEERPATPTCGAAWLTLLQVRRARGEAAAAPPLPPSDDTYDQLAVSLVEGDPERIAAALHEHLEGGVREDLEVLLAPAVELQLRHGEVDTAAALLEAAAPALRSRHRQPLTRAEGARLRGLVALARGDQPEADLREAEAAHEEYGAPYLLARTRLELGRWLHEHGRGAEGRLLLERARETFAALRATPSLADVDEVLSARERA